MSNLNNESSATLMTSSPVDGFSPQLLGETQQFTASSAGGDGGSSSGVNTPPSNKDSRQILNSSNVGDAENNEDEIQSPTNHHRVVSSSTSGATSGATSAMGYFSSGISGRGKNKRTSSSSSSSMSSTSRLLQQYASDSDAEEESIKEHSFSLNGLRRLKVLLDKYEEAGGMELDEFIEEVGPQLPQMSVPDLENLFKRVDANANGSVDWDEISTYLLMNDVKSSMQHTAEVRSKEFASAAIGGMSRNDHPVVRHVLHKDDVTRLVMHPKLPKYVTGSYDGMVKLWSADTMRHERTLQVSRSPITDVVCTNWNDLTAVTGMDGTVCFYNCDGGELVRAFVGQRRRPIVNARGQSIPDDRRVYINRPKFAVPINRKDREQLRGALGGIPSSRAEESLLGKCDTKIPILSHFEEDQQIETTVLENMGFVRNGKRWDSLGFPTAIDVMSLKGSDKMLIGLQSGYLQVYDATMPSAFGNPISSPCHHTLHVHWDQISKIKCVPSMDLLLTSSYDGTIQVRNVDRIEDVGTVLGEGAIPAPTDFMNIQSEGYFSMFDSLQRGHLRRITGMDWSPSFKMICSCAPERDVLLWSPYIQRPITKLEGNKGRIIDVHFNERDSQVITLNDERVVKIWDLRTYQCIQTLADTFQDGTRNLLTATYNTKKDCVVLGTSMIRTWPMLRNTEFPASYFGHRRPVIGIAVTSLFSQTITADSRMIIVWDTCTQAAIMRWDVPEGINDIRLDNKERRLLVGTDEGTIKVFNYDNGFLMKTCNPEDGVGPLNGVMFGEQSKPRDVRVCISTHEDGHACVYIDEDDEEDPHRVVETSGQVYCCTVIQPSTVCFGIRGGVSSHNLVEIGTRSIKFASRPTNMVPPVGIFEGPLTQDWMPGIQTGNERDRIVAASIAKQEQQQRQQQQQQEHHPDTASTVGGEWGSGASAHSSAAPTTTTGISASPTNTTTTTGIVSPPAMEYDETVNLEAQQSSSYAVTECILSLDGNDPEHDPITIVSGTGDGLLQFWDAHNQHEIFRFRASNVRGDGIYCMDKDTKEEHLFVGDYGGYVKVFEISEIRRNELNRNPAEGLPNRNVPLIITSDMISLKKMWRAHAGPLHSVKFVPKQNFLACSSNDCSVSLWDAMSGIPVMQLGEDRNDIGGIKSRARFPHSQQALEVMDEFRMSELASLISIFDDGLTWKEILQYFSPSSSSSGNSPVDEFSSSELSPAAKKRLSTAKGASSTTPPKQSANVGSLDPRSLAMDDAFGIVTSEEEELSPIHALIHSGAGHNHPAFKPFPLNSDDSSISAILQRCIAHMVDPPRDRTATLIYNEATRRYKLAPNSSYYQAAAAAASGGASTKKGRGGRNKQVNISVVGSPSSAGDGQHNNSNNLASTTKKSIAFNEALDIREEAAMNKSIEAGKSLGASLEQAAGGGGGFTPNTDGLASIGKTYSAMTLGGSSSVMIPSLQEMSAGGDDGMYSDDDEETDSDDENRVVEVSRPPMYVATMKNGTATALSHADATSSSEAPTATTLATTQESAGEKGTKKPVQPPRPVEKQMKLKAPASQLTGAFSATLGEKRALQIHENLTPSDGEELRLHNATPELEMTPEEIAEMERREKKRAAVGAVMNWKPPAPDKESIHAKIKNSKEALGELENYDAFLKFSIYADHSSVDDVAASVSTPRLAGRSPPRTPLASSASMKSTSGTLNVLATLDTMSEAAILAKREEELKAAEALVMSDDIHNTQHDDGGGDPELGDEGGGRSARSSGMGIEVPSPSSELQQQWRNLTTTASSSGSGKPPEVPRLNIPPAMSGRAMQQTPPSTAASSKRVLSTAGSDGLTDATFTPGPLSDSRRRSSLDSGSRPESQQQTPHWPSAVPAPPPAHQRGGDVLRHRPPAHTSRPLTSEATTQLVGSKRYERRRLSTGEAIIVTGTAESPRSSQANTPFSARSWRGGDAGTASSSRMEEELSSSSKRSGSASPRSLISREVGKRFLPQHRKKGQGGDNGQPPSFDDRGKQPHRSSTTTPSSGTKMLKQSKKKTPLSSTLDIPEIDTILEQATAMRQAQLQSLKQSESNRPLWDSHDVLPKSTQKKGGYIIVGDEEQTKLRAKQSALMRQPRPPGSMKKRKATLLVSDGLTEAEEEQVANRHLTQMSSRLQSFSAAASRRATMMSTSSARPSMHFDDVTGLMVVDSAETSPVEQSFIAIPPPAMQPEQLQGQQSGSVASPQKEEGGAIPPALQSTLKRGIEAAGGSPAPQQPPPAASPTSALQAQLEELLSSPLRAQMPTVRNPPKPIPDWIRRIHTEVTVDMSLKDLDQPLHQEVLKKQAELAKLTETEGSWVKELSTLRGIKSEWYMTAPMYGGKQEKGSGSGTARQSVSNGGGQRASNAQQLKRKQSGLA